MKKVNLRDVPEEERRSPKGKYHRFLKHLSVALGRDPASLDLQKRQPFDLAQVRIPPGASFCPYHAHSSETELYLVIAGSGMIRDRAGITEVTTGDAFIFHPEEAHQISNDGTEDLVYYVIADNPLGDSCHYPDSGKWAVLSTKDWVTVKGSETEYYDGEE